jgi:putative inorganic carbon (HCO3(-)) transporter
MLAQSRSAMGGLVIGLIAMAAMRSWIGKVLVVLALIAVGVTINSGMMNRLMTTGLETETLGVMYLDARLEIWVRGLQGITDFPLGMGMNHFRRLMPLLYPSRLFPPHIDMAHAHNHLLQAGLDLGIPGLIAYIALWSGAGFLLTRIIYSSNSRFYQAIALGLFGSLTAYFVYGLTDAVALGAKPGFVFWWVLGLVVAAYRLQRATL